jgi:alkaline phosphatase D
MQTVIFTIMKKVISILVLILSYQFCYPQSQLTRIAFGSCSEEDTEEQMWTDIVAQKPQLWIWLGDNVYADTHDMTFLKKQYQKQKFNPDYQQLVKACPVIGIWDDHDYGVNDGGKFYTKKKESKEELLRFLDVPGDAPVRQHEGAYSSYIIGTGKQTVRVILLDTRYFRDTLYRSKEPGKRYEINKTGDMLGEEQWKWLEKELKESDAALNIIGSSIQFIAEDHGYEKWANFPAARQRLIQLLSKVKPKNTFLISGDRHIAEISKMKIPELPYELYDFTSSGLTHTWSPGMETEINTHRVGDLVIQKTFGLLVIDWGQSQPKVHLQIHGNKNTFYGEQILTFQPTR